MVEYRPVTGLLNHQISQSPNHIITLHLQSLNINGFGCLRTSVSFDSDKLNLIIADNEQGKSTLVAALLAAFYGIVEDARVKFDKRPNKQNFTPWESSDQFGVVLEFTQNNIPFTLARNFSNGSVKLIDEETGRDTSDQFFLKRSKYNLGEKMLGLSFADFVRSFYLQQADIHKFHDQGDLTSHIQRIATSSADQTTSETAIENLRTALRNYPYSGSKGLMVETAIKRYNDRKKELQGEIAALNQQKLDSEPLLNRLRDIDREYAELTRDQEANRLMGDWAEERELTDLINEQESLDVQCSEMRHEIDELVQYAEFPASRFVQLTTSVGSIKQLSRDVDDLNEKLRTEVSEPLDELKKSAEQDGFQSEISGEELKEFEDIYSKLTDRNERLTNYWNEYNDLLGKQVSLGYKADEFESLETLFRAFNDDDLALITDYTNSSGSLSAKLDDLTGRYNRLEREQQRNDRRDKKVTSIALISMFFAVLSISVGIFFVILSEFNMIGYSLIGIGVVLSLIGLVSKRIMGGLADSEHDNFQTRYDDCRIQKYNAERELEELTDRMNKLCQQSGLDELQELLDYYGEFERLSKLRSPLQNTEFRLQDADRSFQEIAFETHRYYETAELEIPESDELVQRTKELLDNFRSASSRNAQIDTFLKSHSEIQEVLESKIKALETQENICSEILTEAGISDSNDWSVAVNEFSDRMEKHYRYHRVIENFNQLSTQLLTSDELNKKTEQLKLIEQALPADQSPDHIEHDKEHYRNLNSEAANRKEQLSEKKSDIHRKIAATFERIQSELPHLSDELNQMTESIEKAERFMREVQTAIDVMDKVSKNVYRSWALSLSESTKPLLKALNPKYSSIVFNEDLSFVVHDSQTDRDIPSDKIDQVLSGGAHDEIFLAARLGVASYLTCDSKDTLPIVLDEPFSSVDDDKFLSGMEFLLDTLSRKHQLLLLSCHEQRHRYLERKLPDLYADRINLIHLNRTEEVT